MPTKKIVSPLLLYFVYFQHLISKKMTSFAVKNLAEVQSNNNIQITKPVITKIFFKNTCISFEKSIILQR